MKTLLLILSLTFITTNAYAESITKWTSYMSLKDGTHYFYAHSSIKRNGNKVRVWQYVNVPPDNMKAKSFNVFSMQSLDEFDCVNETSKNLQSAGFSKQNLEGDSKDITDPNPTIYYISPDSVESFLMLLVCKK